MDNNLIVYTIVNIITKIINKTDKSQICVDMETKLNEYLSSMAFVRMIVELEETFGVEIPDEYLEPENLNSIKEIRNVIINLLEKKHMVLL